MSAALDLMSFQPGPTAAPETPITKVMQDVFREAGKLSLEVTEAGSELAAPQTALDQQAERIHALVQATQQVASANQQIAGTLQRASSESVRIRGALSSSVQAITVRIDEARGGLRGLAVSAEMIVGELADASSELTQLQASGAQIQNIAREIQLLAVNAGVEAAGTEPRAAVSP